MAIGMGAMVPSRCVPRRPSESADRCAGPRRGMASPVAPTATAAKAANAEGLPGAGQVGVADVSAWLGAMIDATR